LIYVKANHENPCYVTSNSLSLALHGRTDCALL
jgi:hypothetical protein